MENSLGASPKAKHRNVIWLSESTSRYILKRTENKNSNRYLYTFSLPRTRPCGRGKPLENPSPHQGDSWVRPPHVLSQGFQQRAPERCGAEVPSCRSSLTQVIESRRFRHPRPRLGRSRKSGGLRASQWRRASTSRCSASSQKCTSTASRHGPPTVATGDCPPPGQASPNLIPSPPPGTPTVGS